LPFSPVESLQSPSSFLVAPLLFWSLWGSTANLIGPQQSLQAGVAAGLEEKGFQGLVQDEGEVTAAPRSFRQLLLVTQPEAEGALAVGAELAEGQPHIAYTVPWEEQDCKPEKRKALGSAEGLITYTILLYHILLPLATLYSYTVAIMAVVRIP
jgi:hypothetical protein